MLAPGATFNATQQVTVTAGAGTIPALINQGIGFMANGSIAIDTDAPAGARYDAGILVSPAGALYGTVTPNATDVVVNGLLVTQTGALVYEVAAAALVVNGNGITANGRLAVV
jgi:hypothetical protein